MSHFLDFLERDIEEPLSEAAQEHLAFLKTSIQSASAMVETLVSFARLEVHSGEWRRLSIQSLITESLAHTRLSLNSDDLGLSVMGLGDVMGDKGQLLSLFSHLFDNSVMFCREGVLPEIHVAIRPSEGNQLEIRVEDNGPGIAGSEEAAFRLFQKGAKGGPFQGEGCGLAIARRIAEIHGGTLTLSDQKGSLGGAILCLTLPKAPETSEEI